MLLLKNGLTRNSDQHVYNLLFSIVFTTVILTYSVSTNFRLELLEPSDRERYNFLVEREEGGGE